MSSTVPIAPPLVSVVESAQIPSSSDPQPIAAQATDGSNDTQQNDTAVVSGEPSKDVEASAGTVTRDVTGARETHTSHSKGANEGQVPAASPPQPLSSAPSEKVEPKETATASMSIPLADADKDKTSESTTLSGTQTHAPLSGSSKRKTKDSSSDGALTSPLTSGENPSRRNSGKQKVLSKTRRSSKPSIFSKFFRMLVPCIGPSRSHPIDVDDVDDASAMSEPSITLREKQATKDSEPKEEHPRTPPTSDAHTTTASAPAVLVIPPPSIHTDVILPPTPTKQLLPLAETEGLTSGAVQPPGSTGEPVGHDHSRTHTLRDSGDESEGTSFTEEEDETHAMDEADDEEDRLIMNGGAGIPIGPDGIPRPLLPPIAPHHAGRKCLVLDLDETLVHSSFKSISQADYVVPVEIEYHWHNVYVIKRPGVDNFLKKMGEIYEVVVFTASLSKYADPVLDKLDIHQVVSHRLFRESCYNHKGNYVKDLSQLGRPIQDTIILDNSPASYIFHPNNAVPVSSWFNDPHDTELTDLCPFLSDLSDVDDVRGVLDGGL